MSDTPRTDYREHASFESVWSSWVEAAFARQLERELAEAKKDKARLDWILTAEAETLTALDQWDRDNIDDEINRKENKND